MSFINEFEEMLTGGHHNSLGKTEEVVEIILNDQDRLEELYQCYFSKDEVVRLRVSSAFKRVCKANKEWLVPYLDRFLDTISQIDQASTKWTIAQLFTILKPLMSDKQFSKATEILKHNLASDDDWIVLNITMQTLFAWSKKDTDLREWLQPHFKRLSTDSRKSVAKNANKFLALSIKKS